MLDIDTCSDVLTVAVAEDGRVLCSKTCPTRTQHSVALLPYIDEALASCGLKLADVDAFGVVVGAGSFTGIRVGVSTVKAFCYALGKPAAGVTSLAVLAYNGGKDGNVLAVTDAKQGKVYAQAFGDGPLSEILVWEAAELDKLVARYPGCTVVSDTDLSACGVPYRPAGDTAAALAAVCAAAPLSSGSALTPVYVRRPQAEEERR